ncbi:MAG TPA: protoporphyrinogen oxidase [Burkholderiales bacterium]
MSQTIIIGGGISGLATAWFLRRRGAAVTVLEAGAEPGGTIRTVIRDGFLIDAGPTSTLNRGGALDELIAGLGLEGEVLEADRRAPRYIVKDGVLVPLPSGPVSFVRTPLFSARAKLRLLAEPLHGRAGEEESIAQFVRRRLGPEFLDWAVDPFVSGVYAGDAEKLSVRAAVPRLYALEARHRSLFLGALAAAFRGRGGGARPRARLITFRGGMQTLPRAIAAALGDALRLDSPVQGIERAADGTWRVRAASGDYRGDTLVLALPAARAAELLAPLDPDIAALLRGIYYPPVASVALGFACEQIGRPLAGFGALLPRRLQRETLGVIFSSALFPGRAPAGKVLLTAFIGGARNPAIRGVPEPELAERVLADLVPLLDIHGRPILVHVTRWDEAIPQYDLGHGERLARLTAALRRWPGLHLRANWSDGVSLADSVSAAAAQAAALLQGPRAGAPRQEDGA